MAGSLPKRQPDPFDKSFAGGGVKVWLASSGGMKIKPPALGGKAGDNGLRLVPFAKVTVAGN